MEEPFFLEIGILKNMFLAAKGFMIFAIITMVLSSNPKNDFDENVTEYSTEGRSLNVTLIRKGSSDSEEKASKIVGDLAPQDEDFIEAEDFGIRKMNELYLTEEPKLYSLGLFLGKGNPAQYVAAFNQQSKEAKHLAGFAYAALEGSTMLRQKFTKNTFEIPLSRENTRRSTLNEQCPRRGIPQCIPASLRYRTADGSCNNPRELWWGSSMSTMVRFLPADYHDGIQDIRRSINGHSLPSPREISSSIHVDRDIPLATVSHMLMQWGQFVDHDIAATAQSRGFNGTFPQCCLNRGVGFQAPELMHPDCLPIPVNPRDSFLGPLGVRCLEFVRSGPAPRENCQFGSREQLSQVTSFLDASMVYSSSIEHSDSLRLFRKGLLQAGSQQSRKPFLPFGETDSICRRGFITSKCFKAGDGRLTEQPALISLHIVFLRLHNGIATKLGELNSHWSDEKLYQESRRIVGALVQLITYREFLPIVLGNEILKIFDLEIEKEGYYKGYDININPTIANAFSTAAYRFGHSLVQQSFVRVDALHRAIFQNVTIHNEFDNHQNLHTEGSLDRLLLGLVNQPCQRRDEFLTSELTNHLFETPSFQFGMDLASINIQRGRDHGIPAYPAWRKTCGLSRVANWKDFERVTSSSSARKFRKIYSAVDDVDLFSAGLAEKPVQGGLIGPTFACIIAQQFSNLRKGDRFWFENGNQENSFTAAQLRQIKSVTLAQILCHTMESIETIQPFVFLTPDDLRNKRISCDDRSIGTFDLEAWAENSSKLKPLRENLMHRMETISSSDFRNAQKRLDILANASKKRIRPRPINTNIDQHNRIILKRPLLAPVTVVVKNHAVNSPIIVNDAIYGSEFHVHEKPLKMINDRSTTESSSVKRSGIPHFSSLAPKQGNSELKAFFDGIEPVDGNSHSLTSEFYMPHNADDMNNPNPPNYGFNAKPSNNFVPRNAFFDHFAHLRSK